MTQTTHYSSIDDGTFRRIFETLLTGWSRVTPFRGLAWRKKIGEPLKIRRLFETTTTTTTTVDGDEEKSKKKV